MNAPAALVSVTALIPGTAVEGGYYAGQINLDGVPYGIVVAPKADGEHAPSAWNRTKKRVDGAVSFYDGRRNTDAMVEAGSALAKWARGLRIADFDDWYLPARDELELAYRYLKPGTTASWCWRGDNPSSIPVGYAYTLDHQQTSCEAFRTRSPEAFEEDWHWSSTQYAGADECAWFQSFDDGYQDHCHKNDKLRARAVRRFPI